MIQYTPSKPVEAPAPPVKQEAPKETAKSGEAYQPYGYRPRPFAIAKK